MERVTISAVGDVTPGLKSEPPESKFAFVMELLRSADVRFGHSERGYSEHGHWVEQAGVKRPQQHPRMAAGFKSVPFDVLSIASNFVGAWGPEAVIETVETFRSLDIPTVGAGRNISEARRSAIVTRKGFRIAFLAYVSVLPSQTWATETRAGCAPMRAHTYYEPYEFQPGAPARVVTVPHAADLEHLVRDVQRAKQDADFVFVSLHWGLHFQPRICNYQPIVAHAAIDAGATAILGHHAHQPQGVEIYKGAVILYSIGNFSFNTTQRPEREGGSYCLPDMVHKHHDVYSLEPDPGFVFDYRRHFNEGGIAFIDVDALGLARVTYLPTLMNELGQPEAVRPDQPQFEKSLNYLNWAGKFIAGGVTQIRAVGDRYEVFARASE